MRLLFALLVMIPGVFMPLTAIAADTVLRYVALDTDRGNLRTGPGMRYPVQWVFVREGWPFEVISEYGGWRKLRDIDGTSGWMYQSLLTNSRRAIVTAPMESVYAEPDVTSDQVMLVEKGVVAELAKCEGEWCRISVSQTKGWIRRQYLWGADDIAAQ